MGVKYEIYFYQKVGESDPLDTLQDVAEAIFEQTGHRVESEQDLYPGSSFMNEEGELLVISSYGSEEEEEE